MISFYEFLEEARKPTKSKSTKPESELGFKPGDSAGKMFEILKGRFHNGGREFPDSYRVAGKRPQDIHDMHAIKMFGEDFQNHPEYRNFSKSADISAEMTERFLSGKHHHDRNKGFQRVAWTSQPADPGQFIGSEPEKSVADNMVQLQHGENHSLSEKVTKVGSPINYANPGVNTFEASSGKKLAHHNDAYLSILQKHTKHLENEKAEVRERYVKDITREKDPSKLSPRDRKAREEILAAYETRNKKYGNDIRSAYSEMSEQDRKDGGSRLKEAVRKLVVPSEETPTTVTHTELNDDGSHNRTRVYNLHNHIDQYLDNFHDFHIQPNEKEPASVTIHARHKVTGEVLPIARMAVYGEKHLSSPRGSIVLPSENHKSVKYTGELDTAGEHGNDMPENSLPDNFKRPAATNRIIAPEKPIKKGKKVPAKAKQPEPEPEREPFSRPEERKLLSNVKPSVPMQQRRVAQTGSPFQSMARPGIKRPPPSHRLAPNGYPEHMHQAHKDNSNGGFQDSGQ
jgi:hypothetical protein